MFPASLPPKCGERHAAAALVGCYWLGAPIAFVLTRHGRGAPRSLPSPACH